MNSPIIQKLLFEYETLGRDEIVCLCKELPPKIVRWLGSNHPDNRTRKVFFEVTNVQIGEGTVINPNFIVSDGFQPILKIGERVAISPNVTIICESAPNNSKLLEFEYVKNHLICTKPVVIEDDVWIGANSVILPGVRVGKCSIIGAGSIVTKDVDPYTIVAGVPAKKINAIR